MKKRMIKILAVVFSVVLAFSVLPSCNKTDPQDELKNPGEFGSYDELTKFIMDRAENENNYYDGRKTAGAPEMQVADEAAAQGSTEDSSASYSETNVQVEGVDEADIVKTDGEYVYIIANERFIIADIRDPSNVSITAEIDFSYDDTKQNDVYRNAFEMFLDTENDIVTLLLNTYETRVSDDTLAPEYDGYRGYWGSTNVMVQVIDVSDPSDPVVTREYQQEGSYVSSRRIGEYVYLITSKYMYYYILDEEGQEPEQDLVIPAFKDSAGSGEWELLPLDSFLVLDEEGEPNFIVVSAIDTTKGSDKLSMKALAGSGNTVYMSENNVYVTISEYEYEETSQDGDPVAVNREDYAEANETAPDEGSGVTEDITWEMVTPPTYEVFTNIYKFGVDATDISFAASGRVPGYLINQFSMDEHDGHFRIATTTGESWRTDEFSSVNNLYVLDEKLDVTGKVEGLALTETIKSVRFMGNKAYMVTFRTMDPLFTFDLSDPDDPKMLGELKIPGYSEYLHPVSEDILLGFGKDAEEIDGNAFETGFKVSVFDVSDISTPKETSTFIIGERGTYSELSYNHKALLFSAEKNIIGFPITIYETPEKAGMEKFYYGMPVFTGYLVLGLDENDELFERGRISHYEPELDTNMPEDEEDLEKWYYMMYEQIYSYSYLYGVKRGAFVDDALITVSDYKIDVSSLEDFSQMSFAQLPGFEDKIKPYYDRVWQEEPEGGSDDGSSVDPDDKG